MLVSADGRYIVRTWVFPDKETHNRAIAAYRAHPDFPAEGAESAFQENGGSYAPEGITPGMTGVVIQINAPIGNVA